MEICSPFLGFVPHSDYPRISPDPVTSMHWESLCPCLFPDPTINFTLKSTDTNMAPNPSLPWTWTSYRCCPAEGNLSLCLHLFNKKLYKIAEIKTGHGTLQQSSALMSVTRVLISEGCSCRSSYFRGCFGRLLSLWELQGQCFSKRMIQYSG